MSTKRTRAEYDELGNAAREWAAEAEHARQMVAALKQCMETLQGGDWVGQGARAFYAEMNGQVMPALQRLVKALESASRTTQSISRAVQEAEQAAASVLNGRDAAGGLGAGGLAGALGLAGMAGIGALGGDFGSGNAGGGNGADSASGGGDNGPFSVSDFGVGDRIRTGGINTSGASQSSAASAGGQAGDGNQGGAEDGQAGNGPFTVRDYGVGDPIGTGAGAGGMNAAAAGATGAGGGDPSGGGSSGGGSSGGGGQPSAGGGSGGGDQAQQLDELDQALQSGDPQKIAAALKSQLLKGNQGAMEKFRRLSASMEMQVANAMLLNLSSTELTQLSNSPATQQAMNELSGLRR